MKRMFTGVCLYIIICTSKQLLIFFLAVSVVSGYKIQHCQYHTGMKFSYSCVHYRGGGGGTCMYTVYYSLMFIIVVGM